MTTERSESGSDEKCPTCGKPLCAGQRGGMCDVPMGWVLPGICHGHYTLDEIAGINPDSDAAPAATIERFDFLTDPWDLSPAADGRFVLYETHAAILHAWKQIAKEATAQRDRAKWAQGIVDSVARENTGLLQDAQAQLAAKDEEIATLKAALEFEEVQRGIDSDITPEQHDWEEND